MTRLCQDLRVELNGFIFVIGFQDTLVLDVAIDQRFAVISDIHSNFDSLQTALELILSSRVKFIIILGDILTYGCQVNEVINALRKASIILPCYFVKGNHDQFYFDLENNVDMQYRLPAFISESVLWNRNELDGCLSNIFTWYDSVSIGDIFLAHANPYAYGDWTYIDSDLHIEKAANKLMLAGYKCGIFGHTHRKRIDHVDFVSRDVSDSQEPICSSAVTIVNSGSIGQPRGEGSSFVIVSVTAGMIDIDHVVIVPRLTDYLFKLKSSGQSLPTIQRLLGYFGENID